MPGNLSLSPPPQYKQDRLTCQRWSPLLWQQQQGWQRFLIGRFVPPHFTRPPSLQFKSMAERRHRTHYLRPTRPRAPCCLSSAAPLLSTAALCTLVSSAAASRFQTCGRSGLRAKVISASEADLSTPPELCAGLRSSCCYLSSRTGCSRNPWNPLTQSPQVSSTKISDVAFTQSAHRFYVS